MLKRGTLVWLIPILLIFVSSIISINVEARQSKTIGGEVTRRNKSREKR